ncbi:MAG: dihydroorotate dehydrogenase [Patescibacteria group bacterium]
MSLDVTFLGKKFKSPLVLASGILGVTASSWSNVIKHGAGGVTIKSCSLKQREGHPNPTMTGFDNYFINAVGLSNPGVEEVLKEIETYKKTNKEPLIGSVFAGSVKDFGRITKQICQSEIDMLEVNISCPNVKKEFDEPYSYSEKASSTITKEVKKNAGKVPIIIKLSPDASNIAKVGKACEQAGADALCAINTISGMAINAELAKPILSNVQGGVSGPGVKPVALKCVWDLYENVKIPIIGTGGVTTGEDAVEMHMAGATLIGVGSAVYYRKIDAFQKINKEMNDFMKKNKYKTVKSMIGAAH